MKHSMYTIITLHVLTIIHYCSAMETTKVDLPTDKLPQINILKQLSCIEYPAESIYLNKNRAIIKTSIHGNDTYNLIDPSTDKLITSMSVFDQVPHVYKAKHAIHPNKKIFALYSDQTVKIYDTEIGKLLWEKEISTDPLKRQINSIDFDPSNNTLFFSINNLESRTGKLKSCIYDITNDVSLPNNGNYSVLKYICNYNPPSNLTSPYFTVLCHAIKPFIYLINEQADITVINKNTHNVRLRFPNTSYLYLFADRYSLHDSMIFYHQNFDKRFPKNINICTVNINHWTPNSSPGKKTQFISKDNIVAMAIHPNSTVLATLSMPSDSTNIFLTYWDIATQQIIYIELMDQKGTTLGYNHNSLSFSPDGDELMITTDAKCFTIKTAFEALYQSDTKEKMHLLLLSLLEYKKNKLINGVYIDIPDDIITFFKQCLLYSFRR